MVTGEVELPSESRRVFPSLLTRRGSYPPWEDSQAAIKGHLWRDVVRYEQDSETGSQ